MLNSDKYTYISPQELHQWIAANKHFFLIDTLISDHYHKVHLPKATNACVFEVSFIDQIQAIIENEDAQVVLYGASPRSMDALTAAEKLDQNGYKNLHVLQGGLEAWRTEGLALEGKAVDQEDDPRTFVQLEDRSYIIDTQSSTIEWTGRNANTRHYGNIVIDSGTLAVKGGIITGHIDIDMNSISNTNLEGDELQPVLITHLKSDDFFHTSLFPMARLEIIAASPVTEPFLTLPNYSINSNLGLRGVKAPLDFMATVNTTQEGKLVIEAHFDVDRTRWHIIYGSTRFFEHLGMHMVFDLISIQLRIITI